MTAVTPLTKQRVTIDRTYQADVQDLWDLWTTKDGFESWWGPEGFRVEVHQIDPRDGGALNYDMIADAPEQVAFMKQAGMAVSHGVASTFTNVKPLKSLALLSLIDFIPGVKPYENRADVRFVVDGPSVRMVIEIDPHSTPDWTERASAGWNSQLTKLPAAIAKWSARRKH